MGKLLKNSWALFTGFGILMIAHGLQGNLLGVRSVVEEFNIIATGAMMSGYFVGYFAGANLVPTLVGKVGHIRVFAAFASMASLSILIHAVFVDPIVWTCARFLTGFSIIGTYIVVESWLNDRANNRTRGQVLSVYMFVTFFGMAIGTFLLNFSSPEKYEPFILVSLLLSIALVPILLTKRKPPKFKKIGLIKIKELYKISPFGSISMFCCGFIHSAIFSLTPVYAASMNLPIFEISLLFVLITLSGAFFQWPIGYFSDHFDRRKIIIITSFIGALFCIFSILSSGTSIENLYLFTNTKFNYFSTTLDKAYLFISITIYAAMALPLFALNLALVNDYIPREKFVAAGAGLQIIYGLGAMVGPIACSFSMYLYGANGFFVYLFIFQSIIVLFGLYRMTRRTYEDNPESTFTPLPNTITPLGIELDPSTGADLSKTDKK
jgi:MFS family permease|tara:strand:+ start:421 stop:1731 length:1311 start_codon:yes stop_codon:yes gene_type:complete